MPKTLIGTGTLTWAAGERRSDRYGTVYLIDDGHNSLTRGPSPSRLNAGALLGLDAVKGKLIAEVKANRQSTHIGDLFHEVFPSMPAIGEVINLGEGIPFIEHAEWGLQVGLRPFDGRATLWLKIDQLYRAHEQTVDLYLETPDA